jgi:uncharacterized protein (TIGR03435 family)
MTANTNKTRLTGKYDFAIEFSPDPPVVQAEATPSDGSSGPSLTTAIQQLGLRLESARVPTGVLVIDHAEKPSENRIHSAGWNEG